MKSTPSPTATKSPSPAPQLALSSSQKGKFMGFGRSSSARNDSSEPKKRKKLVKKSLSQPTFEILNPGGAKGEEIRKAEAAQLGLDLDEAVAAIEQGSTSVKLARASNDITTPTAKRQGKRWSDAPLLPELDFGSSSSTSSRLFDPETHTPTPRATIIVSILSDVRSSSVDAKSPSAGPSKLTYRCDIHAQNGACHRSIEQACQKIVTHVGGRLLNSYFYPGGFLYSLPPGVPEPISTCEIPALESKIDVEGWSAFSEPQFDGLRMHPPGGRLGGDRPAATNAMEEGLKARENNGLKLVDAWVEGQGEGVREGPSDGGSGIKTGKHGEEGEPAHKAVESEANATPSRKLTLVKSLELLRRRVSGATRTAENKSTSSKTAQSPGTSSENRYTVILDTSVSGSESGSENGNEANSESGAEEWESVLSELENH